jgi:ketosteroid isomerase-like protein
MTTTRPVQKPITGKEDLGDLTRPEAALAQFYRAFNGRDMALMQQNWDTSEKAAMDNPLGGIKRGWPEIRSVYERLFSGPARVRVEFFDYTLHVFDTVFFAVGRERGQLEAGNDVLELAIRTTRIFRFTGGRWRQVHHHGSIEQPDLLAAYQAAVKKSWEPAP